MLFKIKPGAVFYNKVLYAAISIKLECLFPAVNLSPGAHCQTIVVS